MACAKHNLRWCVSRTAHAGTDLDFKPHVILSFGRSVNSARLKVKQSTTALGSRKTKFSLVYIFSMREAGTDLDFKLT